MSNTGDSTELPEVPPNDFGAALLAEFEKRGTVFPAEGDEPPGGWPGGATANAEFDIARAAKAANADAVADAGTTEQAGDEPVIPSGASVGTEPGGTQAAEQTPADIIAAAQGGAADQPATPPAAPSAGYTWQDGDQQHTFSDDEVRRGLIMERWASSLPDQTRQAFAMIEQGQAVAIGREDYERFTAWRATQERSTRDADLSDLQDVDPQTAQLIAGLRDEVAQLRNGQQPQPQFDNLRGNLDNTAMQIDAATRLYASARNITPEQAEQLLEAATTSGAFRHFAESLAQRHPMSGQVVAPPNWNVVVQQALDFAQFRGTPVGNGAPTAPAPAPTSAAIDPNPPADPGITAKKARAASLASAPSATTPPVNPNPNTLTPQDRVRAMEQELAAVMSRG